MRNVYPQFHSHVLWIESVRELATIEVSKGVCFAHQWTILPLFDPLQQFIDWDHESDKLNY